MTTVHHLVAAGFGVEDAGRVDDGDYAGDAEAGDAGVPLDSTNWAPKEWVL